MSLDIDLILLVAFLALGWAFPRAQRWLIGAALLLTILAFVGAVTQAGDDFRGPARIVFSAVVALLTFVSSLVGVLIGRRLASRQDRRRSAGTRSG